MPNAHDLWGTGTNSCGTNTTDASTGCNGNGDGWIDFDRGENVKAWEHLQLSEIIEGKYDGIGPGTGTAVQLTKSNSPQSKLPSGGWGIASNPQIVTAGTLKVPGLFLMIGFTASSEKPYPISFNFKLSRSEAWGIDTKIDDNFANTGLVRGDVRTVSTRCNDNDITNYGVYGVTEDPNANDCTLTFILDTE